MPGFAFGRNYPGSVAKESILKPLEWRRHPDESLKLSKTGTPAPLSAAHPISKSVSF